MGRNNSMNAFLTKKKKKKKQSQLLNNKTWAAWQEQFADENWWLRKLN